MQRPPIVGGGPLFQYQVRRPEPVHATSDTDSKRIDDTDGDKGQAKEQDEHQGDVEYSSDYEIQHVTPFLSNRWLY